MGLGSSVISPSGFRGIPARKCILGALKGQKTRLVWLEVSFKSLQTPFRVVVSCEKTWLLTLGESVPGAPNDYAKMLVGNLETKYDCSLSCRVEIYRRCERTRRLSSPMQFTIP